MNFSVILKNREQRCECTVFSTDSAKVAKRCVEAMNGAPCCSPDCDHADIHCKPESIKNKR